MGVENMKKLLVLSMACLVLFSLVVLADVKCNKNDDCNDGLKYTKDECKNTGTEEAYCTNEITDAQISFLSKILGKIIELVDKEWTINVEPTPTTVEPNITVEAPIVNVNPNITVIPPEVNVYPDVNVTLPEKECKWEKYYLSKEFDNFQVTGEKTVSKIFFWPPELMASEYQLVNITAYTYVGFMYGISINGNTCYLGDSGSGITYQIIPLCPEQFRIGGNKIEIYGLQIPSSVDITGLFFEARVKPANC